MKNKNMYEPILSHSARSRFTLKITNRRMEKMLGFKIMKSSFVIFLSCLFVLFLVTSTYAGGYIEGEENADYLNAPASGSNVVAYMIGDYVNSEARFHIFVKKCEVLKRLSYADTGVFLTYSIAITQDEFNAITPTALVGIVETNPTLINALADENHIAVIERVLEYKKSTATSYVARVSIKFVVIQ